MLRFFHLPSREFIRALANESKNLPISRLPHAGLKAIEDYLEPSNCSKGKDHIVIVDNNEVMDIAGIPKEHTEERWAKIYIPAREAMQSGTDNCKKWKIELDNRQRWENPLMGWCSSGDPLSNISMNLEFDNRNDAIRFCVKNRWNYEVCEPAKRNIKPKSYSANFSWNKRTRVGTK